MTHYLKNPLDLPELQNWSTLSHDGAVWDVHRNATSTQLMYPDLDPTPNPLGMQKCTNKETSTLKS